MAEAIRAEKDSFASALFLLLISCLLFSSLIYIFEGKNHPELLSSIPQAMKWFILTIISGWGNVDPVSIFGVILVILTQIIGIALAAILIGVVATAYTSQVERRTVMFEMEMREVLADGVIDEDERKKLERLKSDLGMTNEQVEAIAQQVKDEKGFKND